MTLTPVYQQAPLIADATSAVRDAILLGALLSAAVIFLFLRGLRATLVAAALRQTCRRCPFLPAGLTPSAVPGSLP